MPSLMMTCEEGSYLHVKNMREINLNATGLKSHLNTGCAIT